MSEREDMELCVGFDLDMTLVDSRPGIRATCHALSAETGVFIDTDVAVSRLGPPLEVELAQWFPAADVDVMATRYRALYHDHGVPGRLPMPGAHDALAQRGAAVYVGDSPPDVVGARTAGALAVAVASGPHDVDELARTDPDVVLTSLHEFRAWFAAWLARHG